MRSALKIFVSILSYADWVTPTAGIVEDILRGGDVDSHEFIFNLDDAMTAGWSPFTVIWLLNQSGIKTHGSPLPHGRNFRIKINAGQRDFAEYVLSRGNVPVVQPDEFSIKNLWGLL